MTAKRTRTIRRVRGSVGRRVIRKEGLAKVTGTAKYVDDWTFPGMIYGATIRSTIACGEILSVRHAFDTAGFTLADYRDIPGKNTIALIEEDQPCLAERDIRHAAEPIALVAHPDREKLLDARFEIDYRKSEPILDPTAAPRIFKTLSIEKGDLARGFADADVVVEGEY